MSPIIFRSQPADACRSNDRKSVIFFRLSCDGPFGLFIRSRDLDVMDVNAVGRDLPQYADFFDLLRCQTWSGTEGLFGRKGPFRWVRPAIARRQPFINVKHRSGDPMFACRHEHPELASLTEQIQAGTIAGRINLKHFDLLAVEPEGHLYRIGTMRPSSFRHHAEHVLAIDREPVSRMQRSSAC